MDGAGSEGDEHRLADLISRGGLLVLTGAGISTDSGIPDYRGRSGRRRHAAPMTYHRFISSAAVRRRYWARSHVGWPRIASARPNLAHHVITDLERAGRITGVATQNVDGLHTRAGTRRTIDLHGRLDAVVCMDCGDRRPRLELALRLDVLNPGFRQEQTAIAADRPDGDVVIPSAQIEGFRVADCRLCGGPFKPDVVFFGERVPRPRFRAAMDMIAACRALLVLGTSLTVGTGYRMVTAASRAGLPIAIVNRGETRGDHHASIRIDAGLADVLRPYTAVGATV